MKTKFKTIIILLAVTIIGIGAIILYIYINNEKITFKLYGNTELSLYEGEIYNEPGFIALDKQQNQINERVIIESNLNTNIVGEYTIVYKIDSKFKDYILERKITILKDPLKNIDFSLNGNKVMNISLNEEYIDPLYKCFNKVTNADLSSSVQIENNVNNQIVGTYVVNYRLKVEGKEKTLTRTVNVLESEYTSLLSIEEPTNQDLTINFTSNINNFSYIITPDNQLTYEKNIIYPVTTNGSYTFIVYDDENSFKEHTIEITNIDKEVPIINNCTSYIENNKTYLTIETPSLDITNYVINDNQNVNITQFPYTFNSVIEINKIIARDKANNQTSFNCDSYYKEISPKGTETIKHNVNTNTLKVWIEYVNRSSRTDYYVTHIWAKDPYNQFKSQVPNNFGKELKRPNVLLSNAVSQQNLKDKVVIAVNASGFVKNGTWGQKYYDANKNYNLTSGSPIVIVNGKVLRDLSGGKLPGSLYSTYGLKKDGYLAYYTYAGGSKTAENKSTSQKIINDGVLNTFAFEPVLVTNGKVVATQTAKNIRQGFCQIDKNNFVFITDIYASSRNGFSHKELGEYMVKLGCKTGFNLDGGGSVALLFKNKNTSPTVISGNERSIADIIYFHE